MACLRAGTTSSSAMKDVGGSLHAVKYRKPTWLLHGFRQVGLCLTKTGQFAGALCDRLSATLQVFTRQRDLFRSELAKWQIAELIQIRSDLETIFSDVSYVASVKDSLLTTGRTQEEWRSINPDAYEQYQRYEKTSLELFYKFTDDDFYLFPPWLDRATIKEFGKVMLHWAPFTIQATSKSHEEKKAYMYAILKMQQELDGAISANGTIGRAA